MGTGEKGKEKSYGAILLMLIKQTKTDGSRFKVVLFIPVGKFDLQIKKKAFTSTYAVKNNNNNSILNTKTHNKKQKTEITKVLRTSECARK